MSKFFLFIYLMQLSSYAAYAQKLSYSIWQHSEEQYIYYLYFDDFLYEITDYISASYPEGGITLSKRHFGFQNTCDLLNIDSLQNLGIYYFEIDEGDVNDNRSINSYECLELSFLKENEDEYMNIYSSRQQQFSTYRKIKKLPKVVEEYLKESHSDIYKKYFEL